MGVARGERHACEARSGRGAQLKFETGQEEYREKAQRPQGGRESFNRQSAYAVSVAGVIVLLVVILLGSAT